MDTFMAIAGIRPSGKLFPPGTRKPRCMIPLYLECGCTKYCTAPKHLGFRPHFEATKRVVEQLRDADVLGEGYETVGRVLEPPDEVLRILDFPNDVIRVIFDHLDPVAATSFGLVWSRCFRSKIGLNPALSNQFHYHQAYPELVPLHSICDAESGNDGCHKLFRDFESNRFCCRAFCPYTGLSECSLRWHMTKWLPKKWEYSSKHQKFVISLESKWGVDAESSGGRRTRSKRLEEKK